MLRGAVAVRYAQALYSIGLKNNLVDSLQEELNKVAETISSNEELAKVLSHPRVTVNQKKQLIKSLFYGNLSGIVLNFLNLLVERHREMYLALIIREYIRIANKEKNIVEAQIISAIELGASQKDDMLRFLKNRTGKDIKPTYHVDPGLVGGVVVRIGDRVLDGSIRTRLGSLSERLKKTEVREIGVNQ